MHNRGELSFHHGRLADADLRAARDGLVRDVLDVTRCGPVADPSDDPWSSFCYFAPDGRCVANIEAAILPLVVDGEQQSAGAIRAIAVDPNWRGQGLFRDLMGAALGWCDRRSDGTGLLFTEEPALYDRFGFALVPQHAFVGKPPVPKPGGTARHLVLQNTRDAAFLRKAIERRAAISSQCALLVDAPLLIANLASDEDLIVAHAPELDAIVVYELDDDLLVLVDVIAPTIPPLAAMIDALGASPRRIRTLFPPDLLAWDGAPSAEETGLMLRGRVPGAMTRPFMLPPTCEF